MGYMRDSGNRRLDGFPVASRRAPNRRIAQRPGAMPHGLNFQRTSYGSVYPRSTWEGTNAGVGMDVFWNPQTGQYGMLYCASGPSTVQIGYQAADSLDGPWTPSASNPVLTPNSTAGQPDSGGLTFPQVVRDDDTDGLWHIFCAAFPSPGYEVGNPVTMHYTATDIANGPYTRAGVALTASMWPYSGASGQVWRATPFKFGDTCYLFVNAGPAVGQERIHYATAPTWNGPWTAGNGGAPVFLPTAIGDSGNTITSDPELFRLGEYIVMLFWAQSSGIWSAYAHAETEFPNTWHVSQSRLANLGGYVRPVYADAPGGARLFVHTQNHHVDTFTPTGLIPRGSAQRRTPQTGLFYRHPAELTTSNTAAGAGYMSYTPFETDAPLSVYALVVNVTSAAAGSTMRLGIYTNNLTRDAPEYKLAEVSVDTSSTGVKTAVFSTPLVLPRGTYWRAAVAQGASPSVQCIATAAFPQGAHSTAANAFAAQWLGLYTSAGGVTGAMPSIAPNGLAAATGAVPLVVVQT